MKNIFKAMFLSIITVTSSLSLASSYKKAKPRTHISVKPLTKAIILLTLGIDGSSLNTRDIVADGLKLLQKQIKELDANIKLELKKPQIANQRLREKTNKVALKISLDKVSLDVTAVIKNVKKGSILTVNERITGVITGIGTTMDGSEFHNKNSLQDIIKKLNNLATAIDNEAVITLTPKTQKLQGLLVVSNNVINIRVTISNKFQDVIITVNNVQNKVALEQKEVMEKALKILQEDIDGSSLTTNSNFETALTLIRTKLGNLTQELNIDLQSQVAKKQNLTDATNLVAIRLKIGNFTENITTNLVNVNLSQQDEASLIQQIREALVKITGYQFTNENTVNDAFNHIKEIIQDIKKDAVITLNTLGDTTLKQDNLINITYSLNNNKTGKKYTYDVELKNVGTKIEKVFDQIEKKLENIDGSQLLDSNNNYEDAINLLIKEQIKSISSEITVELITNNDMLQSGNNSFKIKLLLGEVTREININISNVAISNQQWLNIIEQRIITESLKEQLFTTDTTTVDVLDVIKNDIRIINEHAKISLPEKESTVRKLQENEDLVKIKIELGNDSKIIAVKVKKIIISNIDILEAKIIALRHQGFLEIDNWDTDKTYQDVINFITSKIDNKDIKVKLISKLKNVNDKLETGDTIIALQLELNEDIVSTNVLVKDIKVSNNDILTATISKLDLSIIN